MKEKGFTLIELLAVIVILAIIALIATPIILGIIDNSKKESQERSAELYKTAVELAVARKNLTGEFNPSTCEISETGVSCGDENLTVEIKGEAPTGGTITFDNNKITSATFNFENFTATIEPDGTVKITTSTNTNPTPSTPVEFTTITAKTWNNLPSILNGRYIWTNGTNIYYSNGTNQYILNGDTWEAKTWNGLTNFQSTYIWTDGTNTYYSKSGSQYILNGDTWESKTWTGLTSFDGDNIWTDGTNTYYSNGSSHYILNGDTWERKTWNGLTTGPDESGMTTTAIISGKNVWTDGTNVYHSSSGRTFVLNGDTWEVKTWNGLTNFNGSNIWTDGTNVYYSSSSNQYVLNGDTWEVKTWNGLTSLNRNDIWTDGTNFYYSLGPNHYIFS